MKTSFLKKIFFFPLSSALSFFVTNAQDAPRTFNNTSTGNGPGDGIAGIAVPGVCNRGWSCLFPARGKGNQIISTETMVL
jgi:hypothetical protein